MSLTSLASLPPDRGDVRTEHRNEASMNLDSLGTPALIELMAADHAAVIQAVRGASAALSTFIDCLAERMARGGRLIYAGAGTSGRLGVLDASECPPTFQSDPTQVVGIIAGGDSALRKSSEGKEDDPKGAAGALAELQLQSQDTLLGIAAGGTTPYVLGAIEFAASQGAMTGLLSCAPLRTNLPKCNHLIVLNTGPEVLTGSTRLKAGSATKLALNIITTSVFIKLGKVYSNLMVDMRATNHKLADRAVRILIELCPELSRDAAAELLGRAGGNLKTAIVMQRLDVAQEAAGLLLQKHNGRLRELLG